MAVCSTCGQSNPAGARFCGACGAALEPAPPPRETRKTVTILFCDVTGSTALGDRLDPEALRRIMRSYFERIGAVIEAHGGAVEKFVGDAVMAVFGIPRVHEDDALRAVRAATEIRAALPTIAAELGVKLAFRTGVNTGEVMVGEGQTLATGDAVNVAARLEQRATPGEILIGAETLALVRDAVTTERIAPLELRGKPEPVPAFRLVAVRAGVAGHERRFEGPLVGRERELRLLREVFERAVQERRCDLFTLLGTAGVGKSRLVREFLSVATADATVVRGRCLSYGEGITFYPLIEVLMQLGDPAAEVLERVTRGGTASAAELYFEVRRLLERVAVDRPLIVVLDDLHWAEPMLLDLLDHIADLSRTSPLLVLCIARPELLEERPAWAGGKLNATTVLLEALPEDASKTLIARLAGDLDAEARAQVARASEGNPLFVEEMVALLQEGGGTEVPPTIQALLTARLERLAEPERSVIERGAVEGKVFHRGAVRELAPPTLRDDVDSNLAALVRKELIRPDDPVFAEDEAYRFRHLLIRDAAYDALPKGQRADLHTAFAGWLEEYGGDVVELDEIAGWHLEQALGYRRELGLPVDEAVRDRMAHHLCAGGERAATRADYRASENMLGRALRVLPQGHAVRPRVASSLAETLLHLGRFDDVEPLISETETHPDLRFVAVLLRQQWLMHARTQEAMAYTARELPAAIAHFEQLGDDRLLATAHFASMRVHQLEGNFGPAVAVASTAAEHARRAGDRGLLTQAMIFLTLAVLFGPADPEAARAQFGEVEPSELGPSYEPFDLLTRAVTAARAARFDDARTLYGAMTTATHEVGLETFAYALTQWTSRLEMDAGCPDAAVAQLARARDELGKLGEQAYRSTCTALLADALYECGRRHEAEQIVAEAEAETAVEDALNFAITDALRARLAADRGDFENAERLSANAVGHAFRLDLPRARADALRARAHVLRQIGREAEAEETFARAIALYEGKGDMAAADRARALFALTDSPA